MDREKIGIKELSQAAEFLSILHQEVPGERTFAQEQQKRDCSQPRPQGHKHFLDNNGAKERKVSFSPKQPRKPMQF